jgi:hypothetical protein
MDSRAFAVFDCPRPERRVRDEVEVEVVEKHRGKQVPARAYEDNARAVGLDQSAMQPGRQGEVPQIVGAELQFEALRRLLQVRHRHDAGVVDEDVERTRPAFYERLHRAEIGQIDGFDHDPAVSGRLAKVLRDGFRPIRPPDRQSDFRNFILLSGV